VDCLNSINIYLPHKEEVMKIRFTLLLVVFCLLGFSAVCFAADPVDLTGKTGIVDPNDLKKDDPKPPKLQKTVPPPPGSNSSDTRESESKGSANTFGHGTYSQAK
jgi:hypothetical protein